MYIYIYIYSSLSGLEEMGKVYLMYESLSYMSVSKENYVATVMFPLIIRRS